MGTENIHIADIFATSDNPLAQEPTWRANAAWHTRVLPAGERGTLFGTFVPNVFKNHPDTRIDITGMKPEHGDALEKHLRKAYEGNVTREKGHITVKGVDHYTVTNGLSGGVAGVTQAQRTTEPPPPETQAPHETAKAPEPAAAAQGAAEAERVAAPAAKNGRGVSTRTVAKSTMTAGVKAGKTGTVRRPNARVEEHAEGLGWQAEEPRKPSPRPAKEARVVKSADPVVVPPAELPAVHDAPTVAVSETLASAPAPRRLKARIGRVVSPPPASPIDAAKVRVEQLANTLLPEPPPPPMPFSPEARQAQRKLTREAVRNYQEALPSRIVLEGALTIPTVPEPALDPFDDPENILHRGGEGASRSGVNPRDPSAADTPRKPAGLAAEVVEEEADVLSHLGGEPTLNAGGATMSHSGPPTLTGEAATLSGTHLPPVEGPESEFILAPKKLGRQRVRTANHPLALEGRERVKQMDALLAEMRQAVEGQVMARGEAVATTEMDAAMGDVRALLRKRMVHQAHGAEGEELYLSRDKLENAVHEAYEKHLTKGRGEALASARGKLKGWGTLTENGASHLEFDHAALGLTAQEEAALRAIKGVRFEDGKVIVRVPKGVAKHFSAADGGAEAISEFINTFGEKKTAAAPKKPARQRVHTPNHPQALEGAERVKEVDALLAEIRPEVEAAATRRDTSVVEADMDRAMADVRAALRKRLVHEGHGAGDVDLALDKDALHNAAFEAYDKRLKGGQLTKEEFWHIADAPLQQEAAAVEAAGAEAAAGAAETFAHAGGGGFHGGGYSGGYSGGSSGGGDWVRRVTGTSAEELVKTEERMLETAGKSLRGKGKVAAELAIAATAAASAVSLGMVAKYGIRKNPAAGPDGATTEDARSPTR